MAFLENGWGQRSRTSISKFRVCCPAIRRAPSAQALSYHNFTSFDKRPVLFNPSFPAMRSHSGCACKTYLTPDDGHALEQRRADLLTGDCHAQDAEHLAGTQPELFDQLAHGWFARLDGVISGQILPGPRRTSGRLPLTARQSVLWRSIQPGHSLPPA